MKKITLVLSALLLVGCSAPADTPANDPGSKVETPTKVSNKDIELLNSDSWFDGYFQRYYIEIHNPNTEQWLMFPEVKATAYDEAGNVLGADDKIATYIANGQTLYLAGYISVNETEPSEVKFTVTKASDNDFGTPKKAHVIDLTVKNVNELTDEYLGTMVIGEVENATESDVSMFKSALTVLYKLGDQVVFADFTSIDDLSAGATTTFETTHHEIPEHDSIEVYAYAWDNGND